MIARHPQAGRGDRGRLHRRAWQFSLGSLFALTTLCAALLSVYSLFRSYPLGTLIFATVIGIAVTGVVLYIAELYLIGWIVDFLSGIGMPKIHARTVPLDCELVGETVVITLRDNIATDGQCRAVQRQLQELIAAEHCDFVLDFSRAGNVCKSLRRVMLQLTKAARRGAEKLGKSYLPVALPRGDLFPVFEDRQRAMEAMSQHGGHGWVVLCGVPVGIRAVYEPE